MRIRRRSVVGIVAVALLSSLCLLPSSAQEAPSPSKAPPPAAPPVPPRAAPPATPPRDSESAPEAEEPGTGEALPADERVSADNNLSFPVDI